VKIIYALLTADRILSGVSGIRLTLAPVASPGDNVLTEFASTVESVSGAVKIQKELKVRNADLLENKRMEFRIGINLGDVIEEGGRIYGDGVNIAAGLEGLAEATGICISYCNIRLLCRPVLVFLIACHLTCNSKSNRIDY
jgi:class 3 adenylate cyclase